MKNNLRLSIRALVEGALLVALAVVLGYVRIFRLPYGGSFDLALVPIFLFCLRWGPRWSFSACVVYGFLEYLLGGGIAISWQSMLLDYVVAEAGLGLCGFAAGRPLGWLWGVVLGTLGRFVSLWLSGGLLWHMYMPESFMGMAMTNPWVYSALYNGVLCLTVMVMDLVVLGLMQSSPVLRKKHFVRQY